VTRRRRVLFATLGSFGDLYPFLAVGRGLRARGHRVAVATHAAYRGRVEEAGLDFREMRPDRPRSAEALAAWMDRRNGPAFVFRDYLAPAIRDSYEDLSAAAGEADVLVSQTLALAAPLLAEKTGVPWVSAAFQPAMLYSAHDPPRLPPLPFLQGPKPLSLHVNALLYEVAARGVQRWLAPLEALRRDLGLAPSRASPVLTGQHSPTRVLAMFSPLFGQPQPDWPAVVRQTGAVFLDEAADEAALSALPGREEGAIVFTLGTAAVHAARAFFAESLGAAERLGRRAVLVLVSSGQHEGLPPRLPGGTVILDYAPYGRVFPVAAAIVHQGGLGTTALAVRAGAPMLVVPHAQDQIDNAARAARLGVARVLSPRRYTARTAASALAGILADQGMRERAQAAGRAIGAEDGVARACEEIEAVAAGVC